MRTFIQSTAAMILVFTGVSAACAQSSGCYELSADAFVDFVCFGPCDCPTDANRLKGTFELEDLNGDGTVCRIYNIDITVAEPIGILGDTGITSIRGFGFRAVGFIGEFQLPAQTRLLLSFDGAPHRQFFSQDGRDDPVTDVGGVFIDLDRGFQLCPENRVVFETDRLQESCSSDCDCDLIADDMVGVDDLLFYLEYWFDNSGFAQRVASGGSIENLLDFLDCWLDASINGCN